MTPKDAISIELPGLGVAFTRYSPGDAWSTRAVPEAFIIPWHDLQALFPGAEVNENRADGVLRVYRGELGEPDMSWERLLIFEMSSGYLEFGVVFRDETGTLILARTVHSGPYTVRFPDEMVAFEEQDQ